MRATGRATLLYAAAFLGAHLAFIPLFAFLLPRRMEALAGGHVIASLSAILIVGAITASLANILAGRASDAWFARHGNRRGMIGLGLAATTAALAALALASSVVGVAAAIVGFQLALNVMFAPLTALLADHIGDSDKGRVAGWLNAALPLASLGTGQVALLFPDRLVAGFASAGALVVLLVLPLLVAWPFGTAATERRESAMHAVPLGDYLKLWTARLLVQLGAVALFNYFYLFLTARMPPSASAALLGTLSIVSALIAAAATLGAGQASDRLRRRRLPLAISALAMAGGLTLITTGASVPVGYVAAQAGLAAFLAIDSATVAQLLAASERRGQWLGVMNLTNTLPAILVPALTWASAQSGAGAARIDWTAAFGLAAAFALVAALLVTRIRTVA